MMSKTYTMPTMVGCFALLCWSAGSSLLSILKSIPIFQLLFMTLGLSFVLTCLKLTKQKKWHQIQKTHWSIWLLGVMGIFGNDLCLVTATKFAPVAHVHLIMYLWPTFVVIFSAFIPKEKLLFRYLIAGFIGLYGIFLLVTHGEGVAGFNWSYHYGYIAALAGAIVWSVYTVVVRHLSKIPSEMIGMYCGIGALLSFGVHLQLEVFVWPSFTQWICLFIIGSTTSCMAFYFWDYGSKFGNLKLLSILSYINPLIGLTILYGLGKTQMSSSLLAAAFFIVVAPCISALSYERLSRWLKQLHVNFSPHQLWQISQ